jgi:ABC-2 type transport system ATP-binding protein
MATDADYDKMVTALGKRAVTHHPEERRLSFEVKKGITTLKELLPILEEAGAKVESFSLHRPTLDDVFLKLTGHGTETKEGATK